LHASLGSEIALATVVAGEVVTEAGQLIINIDQTNGDALSCLNIRASADH
jgi:hypothetical protein